MQKKSLNADKKPLTGCPGVPSGPGSPGRPGEPYKGQGQGQGQTPAWHFSGELIRK